MIFAVEETVTTPTTSANATKFLPEVCIHIQMALHVFQD